MSIMSTQYVSVNEYIFSIIAEIENTLCYVQHLSKRSVFADVPQWAAAWRQVPRRRARGPRVVSLAAHAGYTSAPRIACAEAAAPPRGDSSAGGLPLQAHLIGVHAIIPENPDWWIIH